MPTKIGFLRSEFERIGCLSRDPDVPKVHVGWHFTKIRVIGKFDRMFTYDSLCEILREIPDAGGEEHFWKTADEKTTPVAASAGAELTTTSA